MKIFLYLLFDTLEKLFSRYGKVYYTYQILNFPRRLISTLFFNVTGTTLKFYNYNATNRTGWMINKYKVLKYRDKTETDWIKYGQKKNNYYILSVLFIKLKRIKNN